MNRRYYVFVALASALALATGTAGLLGNPGVAFWLGIMAALAVGYSLIVAMVRARDLSEKYADLDRTATGNYGEVKRLRAEAADTATVVADLRTLVKDNGEANADLVVKLHASEISNREKRDLIKQVQDELQALRPVKYAANELAIAYASECERLVESVMEAEKLSGADKTHRDKLLREFVIIKDRFAEDAWLAENYYGSLPRFDILPTSVLKSFVDGETFQSGGLRLGPNGRVYKELKQALDRKFV